MSAGQTEDSRLKLRFRLILKVRLSLKVGGLHIDVEAEVGVNAEFDFNDYKVGVKVREMTLIDASLKNEGTTFYNVSFNFSNPNFSLSKRTLADQLQLSCCRSVCVSTC